MNVLDEVMTFAEAGKYLNKSNQYMNDLIKRNKLIEGLHFRCAGRIKLIRREIVEEIENKMLIFETDLVGVKWGDLTLEKQEELLQKAQCIDGVTCEQAKDGDCIVDLTEYLSIPGKIIDGEIHIDNNDLIYCPIA